MSTNRGAPLLNTPDVGFNRRLNYPCPHFSIDQSQNLYLTPWPNPQSPVLYKCTTEMFTQVTTQRRLTSVTEVHNRQTSCLLCQVRCPHVHHLVCSQALHYLFIICEYPSKIPVLPTWVLAIANNQLASQLTYQLGQLTYASAMLFSDNNVY